MKQSTFPKFRALKIKIKPGDVALSLDSQHKSHVLTRLFEQYTNIFQILPNSVALANISFDLRMIRSLAGHDHVKDCQIP